MYKYIYKNTCMNAKVIFYLIDILFDFKDLGERDKSLSDDACLGRSSFNVKYHFEV